MIEITGTGQSLPAEILSNASLERAYGLESGSLDTAPGVALRHRASTETQITLGRRAALAAIDDADIEAKDLDLIVFAAAVPFQPIPSTSALIMRELNIPDGTIETFDINTTCLSFLSALDKVAALIQAGLYKRVLIVSSEIASRGLPWQESPETAALFGDGAAAAIIETGRDKIRARRFRTYPSGWELCQLQSGGTRHDLNQNPDDFLKGSKFAMAGRDLYRITLRTFPAFVDELLREAGWSIEEVDTIIPHQASPHAIEHMKRLCHFTDAQIVNTIQATGNMIAASIPYSLDQARKARRLGPGSKVILLGTSAGLSLGGIALEVAP